MKRKIQFKSSFWFSIEWQNSYSRLFGVFEQPLLMKIRQHTVNHIWYHHNLIEFFFFFLFQSLNLFFSSVIPCSLYIYLQLKFSVTCTIHGCVIVSVSVSVSKFGVRDSILRASGSYIYVCQLKQVEKIYDQNEFEQLYIYMSVCVCLCINVCATRLWMGIFMQCNAKRWLADWWNENFHTTRQNNRINYVTNCSVAIALMSSWMMCLS